MEMTTSTPEWPDERSFLHSLSTPLSTIGLELDHLTEAMKDLQRIDDARFSVEQMRKVLDRIFQLVQARRAQLPPRQSQRP